MSDTSTTSNVSTIGGVTTYEQATQKNLYGASGQQTLGEDTFLRLLTTQLQHQDPLNPMDNTQFVAQLSQFSSLEQLTDANKNLKNVTLGVNSVGSTTMVNLIGKNVKAVGNGFHYAGEPKELHYNLASDAKTVNVSILDKDGNTVRTLTDLSKSAGDQTIAWDGKDSKGKPMAAGDYTFSVSASSDNQNVTATTYTYGLVDQLDFSTGVAAPRVDGQTITADKIVEVLDGD